MSKPIFYGILMACVLFGCEKKQLVTTTPDEVLSVAKKTSSDDVFQWQIDKGNLGPIRVGSHIKDLGGVLSGLDSAAVDVDVYKYGGGGKAYEYRKNGALLFALMPSMETDSIIAIMAVHPAFVTKNGLHAGSTAEEILKRKNLPVYLDLMSGGEEIRDTKNSVNFIFDTPEDSLMAEYSNIDSPGLIKRNQARCSWITILH